ncbi:MAG: T9SS type A sorting domain-containing protein [Bacteroidetes bacterium]|nr:T9SS type A sorting domain-containing protein [Bacteroidota bacterium]
MFDLKQNPLGIGFLLLLFVFTTEVDAQYDTIVFSKQGYFSYESIVYMGDQNDDGYDDFVLSIRPDPNSQAANAMFFRGGNPIATEPVFSIPIQYPRAATACDWNRDGYRDIVTVFSNPPHPAIFDIFLGGPNIDNTPDVTFQFSYTDSSNNLLRLKGQSGSIDYNGDGWEELVAYHSYRPTNSGSIVFFETGSTDSIPTYHMLSDSNNAYYYSGNHSTVFQQFADIDGDGCTDISMEFQPVNIPDRPFRKFYYGNPSFAFSDTFKIFDTTGIIAVNDMNGDGKGELVLRNTETIFPYWYTKTISYGSKPPNLSEEAGLNLQNSATTYTVPIGDVNKDGFNDLIIHISYYTARLFLGGNPIPTEKADEYAFSIYNSPNFSGRIGDVTGDGVDDICIGEEAEYNLIYPLINNRVYIMKGVRKPTGVEDETGAELPTELKIRTSPNPFNGSTKVNYTVPGEGMIDMTVYDIMGREIYSNTTFRTKGEHSEVIDFNLLDVSSGTYMIRVSSQKENGQMAATVKVAYIK